MQPGPYGASPPPIAPTPTPPSSGPLSPSGWWYVVAAAFGIGGVVLAIVLGVGFATDYYDRIDSFDRVEVPGAETFVLDAGGYTVYQEFFRANDDFSIPPDVSVNVTGPDGDAVGLDEYDTDFTYSGRGHEGIAQFTFEAEETGEYTVSTEGAARSTIAVGESIGTRLFVGVAIAVVAALLGILVGTVIAVVVAVKRSGAKTRRHLAMVQSGWRPPPGPYPGAPGGPGWPQQPYGQPPYSYQQPPAQPGSYQPPPPGAYGAPPAGYQPPPGAYGAPPAGYQPPPGAYGAPPAGYQPPPGAAPGPPSTPPGSSGPPDPSAPATPPAEHPGYQPSAPTRAMPPASDQPGGAEDGTGRRESAPPPA